MPAQDRVITRFWHRLRWRTLDVSAVLIAVAALGLIGWRNHAPAGQSRLLNVSYDPTRELYQDLNARFAEEWQARTGQAVQIEQSHSGSSAQARHVIAGELQPDVVTLGLPSDVEALRLHGLLSEGWADRLPHRSVPYGSTIVFVVRAGNPLHLLDWPDLIRPGVEVITPDPRTSGNGKLSALAAWGAVVTRGGSEAQARAYLQALYDHAPFLVPAARAAATAFAVEKLGDVHLAWENEALREVDESHGALQIVYPPVSLLAEPAVAWVDPLVKAHGSEDLARAYLEFLFSEQAQEIIARDGYRPSNPAVLARHAGRLPPLKLFAISAIAPDWEQAQTRFFGENGILDTVYQPKPR
ncbi:MAG: sulfate ABC transporter substrate-binding protein [Curvibacter sp.]|nr:sulfate ABC transporter substrate-binding protein [Curvibacter sp.]